MVTSGDEISIVVAEDYMPASTVKGTKVANGSCRILQGPYADAAVDVAGRDDAGLALAKCDRCDNSPISLQCVFDPPGVYVEDENLQSSSDGQQVWAGGRESQNRLEPRLFIFIPEETSIGISARELAREDASVVGEGGILCIHGICCCSSRGVFLAG